MSDDDIFQGMNTRQQQRWLRNNVSEVVWRSETGASIFRSLKQYSGFTISESTFYRVRRSVFQAIEQKDTFRNLAPDEIVPRSLMRTDHAKRLKTNFHYRFEIIGRDPETGEPKILSSAIASNQQHFVGDMVSEVFGRIQGFTDLYKIEIEEINLIDTWERVD